MNKDVNMTPTYGSERIVTLDIIRGIALFGILLVNMKFFMKRTKLSGYLLLTKLANGSFLSFPIGV